MRQLPRGLSPAHFRGPVTWALRLLWTAGLGGVAVFATAAAGGPGDPRSTGYQVLFVALGLVSAALCLSRALLVREQRLPWAACGVAMCCWAAGYGYWLVVLQHLQSPAYPTWSDALWLGYYGASFLGLLALTSSGIVRVRRSVRSDVAVAALAVATIGAGLLIRRMIVDTGGSESAALTNPAYPLFDVAIVSLAFAVFVVHGWRPGRVWTLLAAAWVLQGVNDTIHLYRSAAGTYEAGGLLDVAWPALMLVIAFAAWQPPTLAKRAWVRGPGTLAASIAVGALGLAVLVLDQRYELGPVADVLATSAVLFGFLWAAMTFGDIKAISRAGELSAQRESILDAAGDGIMGIDGDGRLTFVNPAAAVMVGYRSAELISRDLHSLLHRTRPDGSAYPRDECPALASLVDGSVHRCDRDVYWRKDGSWFPVNYTSNPIVDGDRITGAVVVFRDITARLEIERIKDEFTSVVSHELRTPLTSIRASLGLLESGALGPLSAEGRRMLQIAVRNSGRLVRLVDDILDIERIESGSMQLQTTSCDAADLVMCAIDAVLATAVDAEVSIQTEAPPAAFSADADRLVQTLTNLISNAVKFSAPGGTVRIKSERRDGEMLFAVTDDGRGIPAEKLETIFERFTQLDSSDARRQGGTGLGLAICRRIVEGHGGMIWARSEPGEGSTFAFVIPAAVPHELHDSRNPALFTTLAPETASSPCSYDELDQSVGPLLLAAHPDANTGDRHDPDAHLARR